MVSTLLYQRTTLARLIGHEVLRHLEEHGRTMKIVFRDDDVWDGLLGWLARIQNAVVVTNLTLRDANNALLHTIPNRVCANGHVVCEDDLDSPEYSWASTPNVTVYERNGTKFEGAAASNADALFDAEGDPQIFNRAGLGEEIAEMHFPAMLALQRCRTLQGERYILKGSVVSQPLTKEEAESLFRILKDCNLVR